MKQFIAFLLGTSILAADVEHSQEISMLKIRLERFSSGIKKKANCQTGDVGSAVIEAHELLKQIERINKNNSEVTSIKLGNLKRKLKERIEYIENQYNVCSIASKSENPGEAEPFDAKGVRSKEATELDEPKYNIPVMYSAHNPVDHIERMN